MEALLSASRIRMEVANGLECMSAGELHGHAHRPPHPAVINAVVSQVLVDGTAPFAGERSLWWRWLEQVEQVELAGRVRVFGCSHRGLPSVRAPGAVAPG